MPMKENRRKSGLKKGRSDVLVDPPKQPMAARLGPQPSRPPRKENKIDWQELEETLSPEERIVNVQNVDDSDDDSVVVVSVTVKNDSPDIIPVENCEAILQTPVPQLQPRKQMPDEFIPRSSAEFKAKFESRLGARPKPKSNKENIAVDATGSRKVYLVENPKKNLRPVIDDDRLLRLERIGVCGNPELIQSIRVIAAQLLVNQAITKTSRDLIFAVTAPYVPDEDREARVDLCEFDTPRPQNQ